jgi:hypothetical protein
MHSHTVLTASDVRRIARHAQAADLNQQLSAFTLKRLDPNGFSIMSIAMPFHEVDHGGPVHHRVNAFLKMRDTLEPGEMLIDVLVEDWNKLPEATEN